MGFAAEAGIRGRSAWLRRQAAFAFSAAGMRLLTLAMLFGLAHAECDPSQGWLKCRANLTQAIFHAPSLPTKSVPDFVFDETESYLMHGLPGPGNGTGVGNVSWKNGLRRLIWTIETEHVTLNSTMLWSFNTSGDRPANYPPPPASPGCPTPASPDFASYASRGDTLVLYHNGHETASCTPNYDGVVDHLNALGYDVIELMMPLLGCNAAPQYGPSAHGHAWFEQWEQQGDATMRFFIEPVVLAVNFALAQGYSHVVMLGLSGGGWTTTVAAAVDPRIELSIPTAGSTPKFASTYYPHWVPDLPEGQGKGEGGGGDYEQARARPIYDACDFTCMYVLAALEPRRHQLQLLHEHDSCCFAANGLHAQIAQYNTFVQAQLAGQPANGSSGGGGGGWMQTAATSGNYHEVNQRDKVVVAALVERLRLRGALSRADFAALPFDMLQLQAAH